MIVPEIYLVPMPGRVWRVAINWEIETVAAGWIRIPRDFLCDLNSMPRMLWWASTPTDYPEAGAAHDYLYHMQVGQKIADDAYREILIGSGAGEKRAASRWTMLRLFGGIAYRKHAKPTPIVAPGTPHTEQLPNVITGNTPEAK
jgi:hypothetical protein